jgi:surfactin synthase thioesterase subunit
MKKQTINLFCLSHAGGSAVYYNRWKKSLHNSVNLISVELAGRGKRFGEPFYESFEEAVNDVYSQVEGKLEELKLILLPILRADYRVIESYGYKAPCFKIGCDFSILRGKRDESVLYSDLEEWAGYTEGKCKIHEFDGGHFFINNHEIEITDIINRELAVMADAKIYVNF